MNPSLSHELELINYPPQSWVAPSSNQYDVVIIGAGMAGLCAAVALKKLGIINIQIFDKSDGGFEGPWATSARMPTLRSTKELVGPALDIPALTFRAWYEHQFGEMKWGDLRKIPTLLWMDYLRWYREALLIPVLNNHTLRVITPQEEGLKLQINEDIVTTSKLVLATGRGGFGGSFIPSIFDSLPSHCYAHTNHTIDFKALKRKRVGIIGAGASGFDAAGAALKNGASNVDIILRRKHMPDVNKAASICYAGFTEGFYNLSDDQRCKLIFECYKNGSPPPVEALERLVGFYNFSVKLGAAIDSIVKVNDEIQLTTSRGVLTYDFLIMATGFEVDGSKQPEVAPFIDQILLWKDREIQKDIDLPRWFANSPYLGSHFQFLEKDQGSAPFLKDIYCFNYAATLSHGLLSGDIPGISIGAHRLAQGIVSDLFTQNWHQYYHRLQDYQTPELIEDNFNFFC